MQERGGSRDVVIEADGDVDVDFALNLGTSGDSAANFTMNGGNVQVGPIVVGSQGNFNFVGGSFAVANVIVSGGQFTTASDFDFVLADVSVSGNGVITVGGTATIATTLTVSGGSFIADDLGTIPNSFTFTSGLVQLNNGLTIGNADVFGSNFTITQNHQLKTAAATTIGAVTGSGSFPGGGTNFFEGDLRPGASPAEVDFGGDVVLGATASLEVELGGTTPGSEFDVLDVIGDVADADVGDGDHALRQRRLALVARRNHIGLRHRAAQFSH